MVRIVSAAVRERADTLAYGRLGAVDGSLKNGNCCSKCFGHH